MPHGFGIICKAGKCKSQGQKGSATGALRECCIDCPGVFLMGAFRSLQLSRVLLSLRCVERFWY